MQQAKRHRPRSTTSEAVFISTIYQLPTTNYQLPATNYHLPATS